MALKKCPICDRKFSKAEHFKRHERSHTREKPYECNICKKRYSRSDVLGRHVKGHLQKAEAAKATENQPSIAEKDLDGPEPNMFGMGSTSNAQGRSVVPAAEQKDNPDFQSGTSSYPPPSSTNHGPIHPDFHSPGRQHRPSIVSSNGFQAQPQYLEQAPSVATGHRVSVSNIAEIPQNGMPHGNFTDILQPWLFNTTSEGGSLTEQFDPMAVDAFFGFTADMGSSPAAFRNRLDSISDWKDGSRLDDNIPNERFARVQRCWLTRPPGVTRLMKTLWSDTLYAPVDNIFSEQPRDLSEDANRQHGLRWGLDEQCRARLESEFGDSSRPSATVSSWRAADGDGVAQSADGRASSQAAVSTSSKSQVALFPPAEILDMALDQYFRHFHPLVRFIHAPTFCAKNAPLPMLYAMCMIGLLILGTRGATTFVLQEFSTALKKVTDNVNASAMGKGTSSSVLKNFATGVLMLYVAAMTQHEDKLEECQVLYISLFSLAQRHGLFAASEGEALDVSQFDSIADVHQRWKAWARVESVKRLITSLVVIDSWFSIALHTSPTLRPDAIQLILPCDEALFLASSSQRWVQLSQHGKPIVMPSVISSADGMLLPKNLSNVDVFSAYAMLATMHLRVCEGYHRLFCGREQLALRQEPLVPCQAYATDARTCSAMPIAVEFMDLYGDNLGNRNHNCMIMWHGLCLMLTADLRIFELAAGRAGAEPARAALDSIATWSQTPAARRACIHAAQIYKLMFHRRASDGTVLHSSTALFAAALILGLYVFMVPPPDPALQDMHPTTELLDDIDWKSVGSAGLTGGFESQFSAEAIFDDEDPTTRFIRSGGKISMNGVPTHPGYQSARRVLLDYADLLKGVPKWNLRKLTRVLLIMSDVLMDVDTLPQD